MQVAGGFGYEKGRWFSPYCFFSFFFLCQLSDKVHRLRGRRSRQRKDKIGDNLWVSESELAREIGIVGLPRSGEGPLEPERFCIFLWPQSIAGHMCGKGGELELGRDGIFQVSR